MRFRPRLIQKGKQEDILVILKESTVQLGELKKQVDKLVRFFEVILQDVQITVDKDIEDFFRPIENGMRVHYKTNALDSVELSWDGKQVCLGLTKPPTPRGSERLTPKVLARHQQSPAHPGRLLDGSRGDSRLRGCLG